MISDFIKQNVNAFNLRPSAVQYHTVMHGLARTRSSHQRYAN
jgi:hypothetical protein